MLLVVLLFKTEGEKESAHSLVVELVFAFVVSPYYFTRELATDWPN